jgi:P-type conjugative transfer protein TrbJ
MNFNGALTDLNHLFNRDDEEKKMKNTTRMILTVTLLLGSGSAMAQLATVCVNCGNEWTQLAQNAVLIDSYAKQALTLEQNILQYQAMVKHLQENPLGAVLPNLGLLVTNANKILSNGADIGNNMGKVGDNIAKAFKNPQGDFGFKFRVWTNASKEALTGAMLNAGLVREQFADDSAAIQALITKNQASVGDLGALKTLGEFGAAQLQESIKLRDLISAQQLAVNNYMMVEANKKQAEVDATQTFLKQGNGTVRQWGQNGTVGFGTKQ